MRERTTCVCFPHWSPVQDCGSGDEWLCLLHFCLLYITACLDYLLWQHTASIALIEQTLILIQFSYLFSTNVLVVLSTLLFYLYYIITGENWSQKWLDSLELEGPKNEEVGFCLFVLSFVVFICFNWNLEISLSEGKEMSEVLKPNGQGCQKEGLVFLWMPLLEN